MRLYDLIATSRFNMFYILNEDRTEYDTYNNIITTWRDYQNYRVIKWDVQQGKLYLEIDRKNIGSAL